MVGRASAQPAALHFQKTSHSGVLGASCDDQPFTRADKNAQELEGTRLSSCSKPRAYVQTQIQRQAVRQAQQACGL
jgi:hypothetical protein